MPRDGNLNSKRRAQKTNRKFNELLRAANDVTISLSCTGHIVGGVHYKRSISGHGVDIFREIVVPREADMRQSSENSYWFEKWNFVTALCCCGFQRSLIHWR